jgi:hypothetical protein
VSGATVATLGYRIRGKDIFTKITMLDDGAHNDGAAGDGVYGAGFTLAGNSAQYYIYAENSGAGIFSPARAEHEFYEVNLFPKPVAGQLVLNEFLANNTTVNKNEFNMFEDWIELYNATNSTISLDNCYISNENSNRTKYAFPLSTTVAPNSFLMVWADKVILNGSQLHANFKLNEDGDNIIVSDGKSGIIDYYYFGNQSKNVSMARCPDVTGPFLGTANPSYAAYNCQNGIAENTLAGETLQVYPNPANDNINLVYSGSGQQVLIIYDVSGKAVLTKAFSGNLQIDASLLANGVYFISCGNSGKKLIIQH